MSTPFEWLPANLHSRYRLLIDAGALVYYGPVPEHMSQWAAVQVPFPANTDCVYWVSPFTDTRTFRTTTHGHPSVRVYELYTNGPGSCDSWLQPLNWIVKHAWANDVRSMQRVRFPLLNDDVLWLVQRWLSGGRGGAGPPHTRNPLFTGGDIEKVNI
jgi:hypothetical protein